MVTHYHVVVTLIIIIAVVMWFAWFTLDFLCGCNISTTECVNSFIVEGLSLLVISHFAGLRVRFQALAHRQPERWRCLLYWGHRSNWLLHRLGGLGWLWLLGRLLALLLIR